MGNRSFRPEIASVRKHLAADRYDDPAAIDHWFHGVFEGGGAKGIAYVGALLALKERKCWFRAVAGASAGAITAALIASGLPPEDMVAATEAALQCVQTKTFRGLWRLREHSGFFPSDPLVSWIEALLKRQVAKIYQDSWVRSAVLESNHYVTFEELFKATGIELNIVAADLSLKRQVVLQPSRHSEMLSVLCRRCILIDSVRIQELAFTSLRASECQRGVSTYHR